MASVSKEFIGLVFNFPSKTLRRQKLDVSGQLTALLNWEGMGGGVAEGWTAKI